MSAGSGRKGDRRGGRLIAAAARPLILAGGGAKSRRRPLKRLAEALDAPVVLTANARGLLFSHPLGVPASPSLRAVRALMADADLVIAAGTEFGPTDYDMYADGGFVLPANLIRIDIDAVQLSRRGRRQCRSRRIAGEALEALLAAPAVIARGADKAWRGACASGRERRRARKSARPCGRRSRSSRRSGIRCPVRSSSAIRRSRSMRPTSTTTTTGRAAGSTPRPASARSATARLRRSARPSPRPDAPVVCLTGDGGFQFTLPELGTAVDAGTPVIFVVWNNFGYREIETSMRDVGVEPVGVSPAPPDFCKLAEAYGIAAERLASPAGLAAALLRARALHKALPDRDRRRIVRKTVPWRTGCDGRQIVVTGGTGALGGAVLARLVEAGAICHVPSSHASEPAHFAFAGNDRVRLANASTSPMRLPSTPSTHPFPISGRRSTSPAGSPWRRSTRASRMPSRG